jgi:hypothetical protein
MEDSSDTDEQRLEISEARRLNTMIFNRLQSLQDHRQA